MEFDALSISILLGIAIFLFIIFISAIFYNLEHKGTRYASEHPDDWLFHDFDSKMYSAIYGYEKPDTVANKFGIKTEKYYQSCSLVRKQPDMKRMVMRYTYAIILLTICGVLSIVSSMYFMPCGILGFFILVGYEQMTLNAKAESMKAQIADELPRFLDLLQAELQIGMPIENAMYGIVRPTLAPCKSGKISAFLHKYYSGGYKGAGECMKNPLPTVTAWDHNSIVAATLVQMNNHCDGKDIRNPLPTITAGDGHFGEVRAFLLKFHGNRSEGDLKEPLNVITTKDKFGLVTISGTDYQIVDIGLRMLEPQELYGCQGFPSDYIIDHDYTGKTYQRAEQVKRCGNAVCPPIPAALVKANLPELCKAERQPICRPDRIQTERNGQLKFA